MTRFKSLGAALAEAKNPAITNEETIRTLYEVVGETRLCDWDFLPKKGEDDGLDVWGLILERLGISEEMVQVLKVKELMLLIHDYYFRQRGYADADPDGAILLLLAAMTAGYGYNPRKNKRG